MRDKIVFRSKNMRRQENHDLNRLSKRMDDLECRVNQLIVILSDYGKSHYTMTKKVMEYRKEGKI